MDLSRRAAVLLLLVIIVASASLRMRLLRVPLERDEGEYACIAAWMLEGVPPYAEAYTMKLPGIHLAYACVLTLFGHSPEGIHLGLVVINGAAIALVHLLACRFLDRRQSLCAAATYAVLSLGSPVHGCIANAEHFVLVPALAGLWLLVNDHPRSRRLSLAGAGLLLGAALVIKQHAVLFIALGLIWLVWNRKRSADSARRSLIEELVIFLCAATIPFAATCLWMKSAGTFEKFWRWTVDYPRSYAAQNSISQGADHFLQTTIPIALVAWPSLLLAVAGLIASLQPKHRATRGAFLGLFALFSFLAVCPGLYFRQHYFLFLLPVIALAVGAALTEPAPVRRTRTGVVRLPLVAASLALSLYADRDVLFRMTPDDISRSVFGENPFVESPAIAEYIHRTTPPDARIAILGSEPQILFLADRRPATGFLYVYPLTEDHPANETMQRQMIAEIEKSAPELVAVVTVPMSWLYRTSSPRIALDWMNDVLPRKYTLEAVVPVGQPGPPQILLGLQAESAARQFPVAVKLLRRSDLVHSASQGDRR